MNLQGSRRFDSQAALLGSARCAVAGSLLVAAAVATSSAADIYSEPFRPQFHFTPAKNWMNDPNGMVFYDGEYHLFYQYNPEGITWGHMSWGHAVSSDLVHWQHLPLALVEEDGIMIFSGSAVIDWRNTSGFGKDGKPPMVAFYTGCRNSDGRQFQCIAYSNDKGRTWTKYSGNPVVDIESKDFRDPRVFWHEPTKRWIMEVSLASEHKIRFYGSDDLKHWSQLSEFGPAGSTASVWECPDLFPLAVDGDTAKIKWVLIVNIGGGSVAGGSGTQYFIGDFDGQNFKLDPEAMPKAGLAPAEPTGKLIADFEGQSYGNWKVTGTAFGNGPATGALPGQNPVTGFRGHGLINSYVGGDQPQGTLTSPEFEITSKYLNFLIGGGSIPGRTCMNLLVDGQVVRTETGANNEALDWASWNVEEFRNKKAVLEIVDAESGGWGHINVDQIMLSDRPAHSAPGNVLWFDYGRDNYAGVTWNGVPAADGRRLFLGWMSNWEYAGNVPTTPWRSAMTLPRELTLRHTPAGLRLLQSPVRELQALRGAAHSFKGGTCAAVNEWLRHEQIQGNQLELSVELPAATSGVQGVNVLAGPNEATRIGVDREAGVLFVDRTHSGNIAFHHRFSGIQKAPLAKPAGALRLRIVVDACSVEVFANDGELVITDLVLPSEGSRQVEFFGSAVGTVDIWPLMSVWH